MDSKNVVFLLILAASFGFVPSAFAEPSVSIKMEQTTYSYCDKLFYTIEVSELTEDFAILHIRDESGKGSDAIPIPITSLQTPVPSPYAFEKEIFPLGKYFIDIQYAGVQTTAEFNLIDSNKICFPGIMKQIVPTWLTGNISDGFLMDSFERYVDKEIINIPFEITQENVHDIAIPEWVKNVGYWWMEDLISDDDFAQVLNYLIDKKIIYPMTEMVNEI